jgi:hypothetical protein
MAISLLFGVVQNGTNLPPPKSCRAMICAGHPRLLRANFSTRSHPRLSR